MRGGRLAGAAAVALAAAVIPGAMRLAPDPVVTDRAGTIASGARVAAAAPAATTTSPTSVAPPAEEVAITAPVDFSGPVADAGPAPARFTAAGGGQGEVFAVVVGIDDYPGSSSDLHSAVADADAVDAALSGFGVPTGHRVVLRDGQARKGALVAAIQDMVAQGGPSSTLVFAYAGHARKLDHNTEALITADGRLVTDQELAALLAPASAEHVWLLLATCFAGGFTEALGPGRVLTGAADASSLAYENPALQGSYLVHNMVREGWLAGHAGPSVQDAFAYADARIAEDHPDRRPIQIDQSAEPILLGGEDPTSGAPSPPPPQPAAPPTTAPPEEKSCVLVIFCRR